MSEHEAVEPTSPAGDPEVAPEGQQGSRAPPSLRRPPLSSGATLAIFTLIGVYAVDVARPLLLPIVAAAIGALVLRPGVRAVERLRVPRVVTAPLLVVGILLGLGAGLSLVVEPATEWLERAPEDMRKIERQLRPVREPIDKVSDATKKVEEMASMDDAEEPGRLEVDVQRTRVTDAVLASGPAFVAGVAVSLALLLLFLLASDQWPTRIARMLGEDGGGGRQRVIRAAETVERDISAYLLTIGAINGTLGLATAGLMALLGVPNPLLWGVMAALFNFVPYLGAMVTAVVIGAVSILTFDDLARAMLPPLLFVGLTGLEGLVITPQLVGRRLRLHPLAVLLALLFWSWLWGVAGALVAVPILAAVKLSLERTERFASLAKALEP